MAVDDVLLEVRVRAPEPAKAVFARREEDMTVTVRGPGLAGAGDVRPMDGGGAGCGEVTALAFVEVGLSQDEKKFTSSAGREEALEVSKKNGVDYDTIREPIWWSF